MLRKIICPLLVITILFLPAALMAQDSEKLNLNEATVEQLITIDGIDEAMARKIVDYRDTYGEFVDLEELLYVDGFDSTLFHKIKPYIEVEEVEGCAC